ncbi:MAG: hypothetical protein JNM14_05815 [Ferruginibacter sp.]|nr:hypothetical protein [Ferruginibacter sp.]
MKKILIATNVITASMLLFAFGKPDKNKVSESTGQGPVTNISLGVNTNVAKDIVANYKTGIWNGRKIDNNYYKDARSVWFSLAKLKNFIADLESKVKNGPGEVRKCDVDDFELGVRIYFGNYPGTEALWKDARYGTYFDDHLLPKRYMGLHTVMLVPTLYNPVDSFHYDFDPRYISRSGKKCMAMRIDSVMNKLALESPAIDGQIARNEFYGIMPSNRDNKALFSKVNNFINSKDGIAARGDVNVDFTNAGTLVPPPDPQDFTVARKSASAQEKYSSTYNVPCSGASFMRWVDGLPLQCGQYQQSPNSTQRAIKTEIIKQQ